MLGDSFSLDFGESYLKVVECEKKNFLVDIKKIGLAQNPFNIYITDSESDLQKAAETIRKIIKDAGIKKKNVNLIIPDSHSYTQIIEMPLMTEKELSTAIKYHADQFIPIPIDKVGMDVEILSIDQHSKKNLIMLVASPNAIINKVTDLAEIAGLTPISIENESSAITRLFFETMRFYSSDKSNTKEAQVSNQIIMILNFGISTSSLYLLDMVKKIPINVYNFTLGMDILVKDLKANYNITTTDITKIFQAVGFTGSNPNLDLDKILSAPVSELVSEIERFVVASKSKFNISINKTYLIGEGSSITYLDQKLSNSLGFKVELFDLSPYLVKSNLVQSYKNDLVLFVSAMGSCLR